MATVVAGTQEEMASSMLIRTGFLILATPDPIPIVDEVLGVTLIIGGLAWKLANRIPSRSSGGITMPAVYSPIPTATGTLSRGGKPQKQISSTSHFYSRRKKYDYGKRKRYNRY